MWALRGGEGKRDDDDYVSDHNNNNMTASDQHDGKVPWLAYGPQLGDLLGLDNGLLDHYTAWQFSRINASR